MTAPITAARTGGVSFRVGGIPVTIHLTFLLVIAFLGFDAGGIDRVAVWVAVATAAVLVHELGHAVVGRLAGLQPRIDLAGFGGVTSWSAHQHGRSRGGLGRGWSLAISLAGPFTGFLGGGIAVALGAPCCTIPAGGDLAAFAAGVWLFASFGWGILNLLPILPLDGGQALRELLPGTPAQRLQRAAAVGVVVGGLLVAWALTTGQAFLALLAGWIAWSNVQQVQAARSARPGSPASRVATLQEAARAGDAARVIEESAALYPTATEPRVRQFAVLTHVQGLLRAGRTADAYRAVVDPRRDVDLPTELVGGVVARHPDRREVDTVARGWAARATHRDTRGLAAVVLSAHGHHDEVLTLLRGATTDPPVRASDPSWRRGSPWPSRPPPTRPGTTTPRRPSGTPCSDPAGCAARCWPTTPRARWRGRGAPPTPSARSPTRCAWGSPTSSCSPATTTWQPCTTIPRGPVCARASPSPTPTETGNDRRAGQSPHQSHDRHRRPPPGRGG